MNIECISEESKNISSMLIMTEVQLLISHFNNDLDNNVLITIFDTDYSNDWISLQCLKHFDRFSQKHQKKAWRMLMMNDYESHYTHEFLFYCENHKIILFDLSLHTTYLLQSLDVCVFQSLKHWHSKTINWAVQMSDEIFSKVKFLTVFNEFWIKVFKESIIQSAWKHTDLISFDLKIILNKVQIIECLNWSITSLSTINDSIIWKTSTSQAALENQLLELTDESTSEEFTTKLCTFWIDWPRRVESSRSGRVLGPPRLDSDQDFGTEYSGRVTMFEPSIRAGLGCWNRVLTRIPDPARQDIKVDR